MSIPLQREPSATGFIFARMPIRDLQNGHPVEQALLLREIELRRARNGNEFLACKLADRTGMVPAKMWDGFGSIADELHAGAVVIVTGQFAESERWGREIKLRSLRLAQPGEYDPDELLDGPPRAVGQMEADLRELVATVQDPHLHRLLDVVFAEDSPLWRDYRIAPAAKYYHQAYAHGLLEHSLTVAQGVSAMCATFPGIDRDVAVTGALLHDIGKLEAYTTDPSAIDLTDAGRLQGEIPLGYYRIRRAIEDIPGFPPALAQAVLHIILSHHGSLEHGSPVVPATREATLVHFLDNLGGRLGSFDRIEKELPAGQQWSGFDKAIGGGAYFAEPRVDASREAA